MALDAQQAHWQEVLWPIEVDFPGVEGLIVPSGTTAQRPGSPADGYIRYNSDITALEARIGGVWTPLSTIAAATTFLGLTDTPGSFVGTAFQALRVNGAATDLEFTPELKILPSGALDVSGTATYETLVVSDDIIPNKKYVDDQDNLRVATAGDFMDGGANLTFAAGGEVLGLPAIPTLPGSAASKAYVDALAAGLDPKQSVRTGTTDILDNAGNGVWTETGAGVGATLTAGAAGTTTIGGTLLTDGDRVLVKDEDGTGINLDATNNGIYVSSLTGGGSATVLTRATDQDGTPGNEVSGGNFTFVEQGTLIGSGWTVVFNGDLVVDTDAMNWTQFSDLGTTSLIADADGDTKVDVEETPDEDIIRFDAGESPAGYGVVTDIMTLASSGWTVAMGTANVFQTAGAPISITAGTGSAVETSPGGTVTITGGAGGASVGDGGTVSLIGGSAVGGGTGGAANVTAGAGASLGGAVNLQAGASTGTDIGGAVNIDAGTGGTGAGGIGGAINLTAGDAGATSGEDGGKIILLAGTEDGGGTSGFIEIQSNLQALNAAGPAILDEAASATNPTLIPERSSFSTGIGAESDDLSFINAGIESLRVDTGGAVILRQVGGSFRASNAAGPTINNVAASATVPTLIPDRSVSTSGIGKAGAAIDIIVSGESKLRIGTGVGSNNTLVQPLGTSGLLLGSVSGTFGLHNVAASAIVPTLLPTFLSESTGIGGATGTISLITAGVSRMVISAANMTQGNIYIANGTTLIPIGVGADTEVLTADSGEATGVRWAAAGGGGGTSIIDADADTKVDVEETADEDIVRIDTGDTPAGYGAVPNILTLASSGLTVAMGTANVAATAGAPINITSGTGNTSGDGGTIRINAGGAPVGGTGGSVSLNGGSTATGTGGGVKITAGTGTGATFEGGGVQITAGNTQGDSVTGGSVNIQGGIGLAGSNCDGGDVSLISGRANVSGDGGSVFITGGRGGGSNNSGGTITIEAGLGTNAASNNQGGFLNLRGGDSGGSGAGGEINLDSGIAGSSGSDGNSGDVNVRTANASTNTSGSININTGIGGSGISGTVDIRSGGANTGTSGNIALATGGTVTTGTSGSITLATGTSPSGTVGSIDLNPAGVTTISVNGTGIGFFGTAPVAQPTAVPVSIAAVHAALVSLGLIT